MYPCTFSLWLLAVVLEMPRLCNGERIQPLVYIKSPSMQPCQILCPFRFLVSEILNAHLLYGFLFPGPPHSIPTQFIQRVL